MRSGLLLPVSLLRSSSCLRAARLKSAGSSPSASICSMALISCRTESGLDHTGVSSRLAYNAGSRVSELMGCSLTATSTPALMSATRAQGRADRGVGSRQLGYRQQDHQPRQQSAEAATYVQVFIPGYHSVPPRFLH